MQKHNSPSERPGQTTDGSTVMETLSVVERRRRAMAPTVYCPEQQVAQCVSRLGRPELSP